MDKRYANNSAFLFSCVWFLENLQLERNISMGYSHGKKKVGEDDSRTYEVNDVFHVFKNIKNTPHYWRTKKMELLAKLDNFGPFNMFFTLSCADSRWQENFSSLLHELDMNVTHSIDDFTQEVRTIVTIDGKTLSLDE